MNVVAWFSHSFLLTNLWGGRAASKQGGFSISVEGKGKSLWDGASACKHIHAHCPPAHLLAVLWKEPVKTKLEI